MKFFILVALLFLGSAFIEALSFPQRSARQNNNPNILGVVTTRRRQGSGTLPLSQNGEDIDAVDQFGQTALSRAAETGQEKLVEDLIQNGANVDIADKDGLTPLHKAAFYGHEKVVDTLIRSGANVYAVNNFRNTALYLAELRDYPKIVDLLKRGAGPRIADRACTLYSNTLSELSALVEDRVLFGEPAKAGEFPWMAALGYLSEDYQITFGCGGIIISEFFILTAAHCVLVGNLPVVVRLGEVYLTDEDARSRPNNRRIDNIVMHPDFVHSEKKNDIALIRVTQQIFFSNLIKPACLNSDRGDANSSVKLIATGWGVASTEFRNRSNVLLKVDLATVPLEQCNTQISNYRGNKDKALRNGISESQYCAHDSNPNGQKDTCQGDSGGPLQIISPSSKLGKIVGIVSFGVGCGTSYPSIYTRVAYFLYWIEPIVWPNSQITTPSIDRCQTVGCK